jgi:hypothetical protein
MPALIHRDRPKQRTAYGNLGRDQRSIRRESIRLVRRESRRAEELATRSKPTD